MSLFPSLLDPFAFDVFDVDPVLYWVPDVSGTQPSQGGAGPVRRRQQRAPALNFDQNDKEYILSIDVPGFSESEVGLDFDEGSNVLTIKAEPSERAEAKFKRPRRGFSRRFTLPQDANAEGICACLEHGVLCIKVPKKAPPAPRKIPIAAPPTEKAQIGGPQTTGEQGTAAQEGATAEEGARAEECMKA